MPIGQIPSTAPNQFPTKTFEQRQGMNYTEAMVLAHKGYRVTRSAWRTGMCVVAADPAMKMTVDPLSQEMHVKWMPSEASVNANDWMTVKSMF